MVEDKAGGKGVTSVGSGTDPSKLEEAVEAAINSLKDGRFERVWFGRCIMRDSFAHFLQFNADKIFHVSIDRHRRWYSSSTS